MLINYHAYMRQKTPAIAASVLSDISLII